jgi:hypothetical protein
MQAYENFEEGNNAEGAIRLTAATSSVFAGRMIQKGVNDNVRKEAAGWFVDYMINSKKDQVIRDINMQKR